MVFSAKTGETFVLPKSKEETPHLWVILTEPLKPSNEVIIVNLTAKRDSSDITVILNEGDHPFIKHPTVVYYIDARLAGIEQIRRAIDSGLYDAHTALSSSVLKTIQDGLLQSRFTPGKIKKRFKEYIKNYQRNSETL